MADLRIRRQIVFLDALLMSARTECECFTAKRKAAKQLGVVAPHMDAHTYREQKLGGRASERLRKREDLEDVTLLNELDRRGRQPGTLVREIKEVLNRIRSLAQDEK